MLIRLFFAVVCMVIVQFAVAQITVLQGRIIDKQSDEPIPFASVQLLHSKAGMLTDSLGRFNFNERQLQAGDTLQITSVGYVSANLPVALIKDSSSIEVQLEVAQQKVVTVKAKYNRALWFWKRIIEHKPQNDRRNFNNYSFHVYNKLELDVNNVNKNKLGKLPMIKNLRFIFNYVDSTSEDKPYLPVYLTESLSDYYYQKDPRKTREVIKATSAIGIDNESIIKQLGNTYQNVNVYDNKIPVFDRMFVGPFSDNGDVYYNFRLLDTQYLSGKRLVHFAFTPKHPGADMFTGDAWVHDTSFSIQKIMLRPAAEVNINFLTGLTLIQEFRLVNDSVWFLYKDKFVADISPIGKQHLGLKARKNTTYTDININNDFVTNNIDSNKSKEDILLRGDVINKPDSFWARARTEPLNKNERTVYTLLDTLMRNKKFVAYRNFIGFATTGTKDLGPVRIGPWYNWYTSNKLEGSRLRFDLATNKYFNEHIYFHGYLAYGFGDQKFKGEFDSKYVFSRTPWSYVEVKYKNDIDNGAVFYDQLGTDNIFAYLFRKSNIPSKYQRIEQRTLTYYQEVPNGFGFGLSVQHSYYQPLLNLPGKELFPVKSGYSFDNFTTSVKLRYAYQERYVEDNFNRNSYGSEFPIAEVNFQHGWPGVYNSAYKYNRLDVSVHDYLSIAPYGTLYYRLAGGKVWGTLPYELLEIQPGNEYAYYSRYAFNLMNRFEYITDKYASFSIEHNVGSGLFRYTRLTRKLKLRQFWEAKGVVGDLNKGNTALNIQPAYPFKSLDGKLYLELGTGVDNIFKFFRIDFIWRVLPQPLPENRQQKFGVFAGFRVAL